MKREASPPLKRERQTGGDISLSLALHYWTGIP
jgi:hypothetical protein